MNLKKTDLKSKLSAAKKNAKKKGTAAKKRKKVPFHGFSKQGESPAAARREGKLVVPIGLQTVLAVVVCCVVFLVAGIGFYGAQQLEIQNLKNELKAYVADGLVPAGSMDSSVTLNIEAVGGRVANLEKMMSRATSGELTNEELLWIGTELNAVHAESQVLNDILNDVEADKNVRKVYADTVQGPIVVLQETYSTLSATGSDGSGESANVGAAGNTGAFNSSGNMETGIRWAVVIIVVAALLLAAFLLRRKLPALLLRHHKEEAKASPSKKPANRKPAEAKKAAVKNDAHEAKGKQTHEHPFVDEKEEETEESPVADANVAEETEVAEALSEEEAFLAHVEALRKMAESERKNAEDGNGMIAPSPEDLMVFDASVENQDEIEAEEDPFFQKNEEDIK